MGDKKLSSSQVSSLRRIPNITVIKSAALQLSKKAKPKQRDSRKTGGNTQNRKRRNWREIKKKGNARKKGRRERERKESKERERRKRDAPIVVIPTPTMFTGVMSSPKAHAARDIVDTSCYAIWRV